MNKNTLRVEIIGCMASGKTTLCETMGRLGWDVRYEPYEQNPFLTDFFDGKGCAFETQMCFLLQHYNMVRHTDNSINGTVCDFSFLLDSIYACILLSEKEQTVYNKLLSYITSIIGKPDYIIKLVCPDDVIVKRINDRNRHFEKSIDVDFIKKLNRAIQNCEIKSKHIVIDSSKVDLTNEIEVYEKIIKRIEGSL